MSFELPPGVPLSQIPAAAPPAGVTPNFNNPPSLERLVIGVCTVLMALTIFFVTTRLYLALQSNHGLALDEYCCVIAMVLSFSYTGMALTVTNTFRHSWDIPLSFYSDAFFKKQFTGEILLGPSIFFAKTSLLLLYLRIFGPKQSTRYAIYVGLVFAFCLYWINIPITAYYCAPSVGRSWNIIGLGLKCQKTLILGLVQGPLNVVLDLFIFILPIPVVMRLQMSSRRRFAVLSVFLTGILAVAASVVDLVYRVKVSFNDDLWYSAILYICITLEMDVSIICSSMPAFASFSKIYVAKARDVTSLRDRFASYLAGSKTKLVSRAKPFPHSQRSHFEDDHSDTISRLYVGQYSELNDRENASIVTFPGVLTKIHAAPYGDLEEGIIMESLSVEQTTDRKHVADQL